MRSRLTLVNAVLLAMVAGALLGWLAPQAAASISILATLFLRLIRSIIAPVIFSVLVAATAEGWSSGRLGRLGWRAIIYFELASAVALLTGWAITLLVEPGKGAQLGSAKAAAVQAPNLAAIIEQTFPSSIFDAMARGDVLQIVVFSLLLGLAAGAIGQKASPLLRFTTAVKEAAFQYTRYIMYMAPPAVFAAMAGTVADSKNSMLAALSKFVAAAWAAQVLYLAAFLVPVLLIAGVNIRRFARKMEAPMLVAFATTSSAAALPQTLQSLEDFGAPKDVVGVVAPLSLSLNLAGSCIHLAMGALFVAQAAGMALSWREQLLILLTLKLTSKGVAGIPRANLVILSGLFVTFGMPLEGLTLLLGVDALIDPVRTTVNVLGHCVAVPVLARFR